MNLPKPEYLSFNELAIRWGYSEEYVHDLIRTGKIIPEIALSDAERYVGGEFSGGYLVGDIENATHKSYSEYYVGVAIDQDNHYENRPRCNRLVYCHSPVDDGDGGYLFQFVSESIYPGETEKWFYLDHAAHIGNADWKRFRFVWSEIERYECENANKDDSADNYLPSDGHTATALPEVAELTISAHQPERTIRHTIVNRVHVLDTEIEEARKIALNPADANSVWAALVKLAESESGCFLGIVDGKLKYRTADGGAKYFIKKNLRDRLARAKTR